ncbi:MAG: hypothetical protein JXA21_05175 [Anaerolineae bacterium]|nr:hypothetical protein [Anaerolineae bacterium]
MCSKIYFNGINAATGTRLFPPMSPESAVSWLTEALQCELRETQDALHKIWEIGRPALGTIAGIDPESVEEAKWGVIFHPDTPKEVREALADLIAHRHGRTLEYKPNESPYKFRRRHDQGPGVVNPDKLPYYLLIVGPPTQIPFHFQYGLDSEHAVGRLCFDKPEDYRTYAKNVCDYEGATGPLTRERRVAFFSPENPGDAATSNSALYLATPLAHALNGKALKTKDNTQISYCTEHITGAAAKKKVLRELFTRTTQQPTLLFTATHGMWFPKGHPGQEQDQGALACSEWTEPDARAASYPVPDSMYFAGRHLPNVRLDGLIVFAFACYSAGTPHLDDFAHLTRRVPAELAPRPFVAQLPQRLLAQGALAFVGHVDQAWGFSFLWQGIGKNIETFQSTLETVLKGVPVGCAFEYFNRRYLDLNEQLTSSNGGLLSLYEVGDADIADLVDVWTARNDARAYVLFGDPAVRLRPERMPTGPSIVPSGGG